VAHVKEGLTTGDNVRFIRRWWETPSTEIGPTRAWAPLVKGEEYARWYYDPTLVILWERDGEELREFRGSTVRNDGFYFHPGLTWQAVSVNRRVRFRHLPAGCVFDHRGRCIFPVDHRSSWHLLGLLNSSLVNLFMLALTQERDWQVGEVSLIPVALETLGAGRLAASAQEAHDLWSAWDTGAETSSRFIRPRLLQVALPMPADPDTGHPLAAGFSWPTSEAWQEITALAGSPAMSLAELLAIVRARRTRLEGRIAELEALVDREVFHAYGLEAEAGEIRAALDRRLGVVADDEDADVEDAEEREAPTDGEDLDEVPRLLSFYARQAIATAPQPLIPLDSRLPDNLFVRVRDLIAADWGQERATQLFDELHDVLGMSLEDWLTFEYFPYHVRLYRNRPIFWLLWSATRGRGRGRRAPAFACFLDYHRLTPDTLRLVRGRLVARALDQARAEAERLEREATEERIAGTRQAARLIREAGEARSDVAELERFDGALGVLLAGPDVADPPSTASWRERMVAVVRQGGYAPDIDYGVLVNLTPLREAGILHPAAAKVT
jgi:hypothetical protein